MANKEHLAIMMRGVEEWNKWRIDRPNIRPDLSNVNLSGWDLNEVNFSKTDLLRADLSEAYLRESNFLLARLIEANLSNTNLAFARLSRATLCGAKFVSANLFGADLNGAVLLETDLNGAIVKETTFGDLDLRGALGLETINHLGPSTVGIDTIYLSQGRIPKAFLQGAGVQDALIAYADSLVGKPPLYHSCFICHSSKDQAFCDRLYSDLQTNGVRVWYFPEDAKWGEPVWGEIDSSIKKYDKLIVVCSENSLQSPKVLREIDRALEREDNERKNILFPISIDDYIFAKDAQGNDKWQLPRRADVIAKVVGDFSGWDTDAAKSDKAFDKLLKGLQAS
jgi:hypothetical protein